MSSLLKAFNNHLLEFTDDIIRIFPQNLEIKTGKTFIEGIKRVNPKKIITYWRDNILNLYEIEITEGDIIPCVYIGIDNDMLMAKRI